MRNPLTSDALALDDLQVFKTRDNFVLNSTIEVPHTLKDVSKERGNDKYSLITWTWPSYGIQHLPWWWKEYFWLAQQPLARDRSLVIRLHSTQNYAVLTRSGQINFDIVASLNLKSNVFHYNLKKIQVNSFILLHDSILGPCRTYSARIIRRTSSWNRDSLLSHIVSSLFVFKIWHTIALETQGFFPFV